MRNRSSAMAITNNAKKRMSNEIGLTDNMDEEMRKDKITNYIEEKLKNDNKLMNLKTNKNDYHIDLVPPAYLDIKKEYYSQEEKPILFHDKAMIIDNLNKRFIGDIESYSQHVDFQTFLAQFRDEEEVSHLEIQDLLNIDYEKLGELKERANDLISVTSGLIEKNKEGGNEELLIFFCEKLNDLKKNEINIQLFINNVDKVDSLVFSNDKSQVYFQK